MNRRNLLKAALVAPLATIAVPAAAEEAPAILGTEGWDGPFQPRAPWGVTAGAAISVFSGAEGGVFLMGADGSIERFPCEVGPLQQIRITAGETP